MALPVSSALSLIAHVSFSQLDSQRSIQSVAGTFSNSSFLSIKDGTFRDLASLLRGGGVVAELAVAWLVEFVPPSL